MSEWFKRSWAQLLVVLGVTLGALAVFFTRKREAPTTPPPAPVLPPVDLPAVNTAPAADYEDAKVQPVDVTKNGTSGPHALLAKINLRHR